MPLARCARALSASPARICSYVRCAISCGTGERPVRAHRAQLHFGRALQIVEIVPSLRDSCACNHHAVILEEQDIGVAHRARDAIAFRVVECETVVVLVDRRA